VRFDSHRTNVRVSQASKIIELQYQLRPPLRPHLHLPLPPSTQKLTKHEPLVFAEGDKSLVRAFIGMPEISERSLHLPSLSTNLIIPSLSFHTTAPSAIALYPKTSTALDKSMQGKSLFLTISPTHARSNDVKNFLPPGHSLTLTRTFVTGFHLMLKRGYCAINASG